MEMHDFSKGIEVAESFAIDIVPMLGMAMFMIRAFQAGPDVQGRETRDLLPIAWSLAGLKELERTLPGLIAEMERLGIPHTGSIPPPH